MMVEGTKNGDLENIAKELCDILYGVYGTILEHGLQDKIEEIFQEVHNSHMSKDYSPYKMIKGESYFKPDVKKFLLWFGIRSEIDFYIDAKKKIHVTTPMQEKIVIIKPKK